MIPCVDRATNSSVSKKLVICANLVLSENGELKYQTVSQRSYILRKQKGVGENSQISALLFKLEKQTKKKKSEFKTCLFGNPFPH